MNLIQNPTFAGGVEGWVFHTTGKGSFTVDGETAVITIERTGSNVQLYQPGLTLRPAMRYRLSFWAGSNDGHDMSVYVHQHGAPYDDYGLRGWPVDLSQGMSHHETFFTTPDSELGEARLRFWFAPFARAGTVYRISDVELAEATDEPSEPEDEPDAPPAPRRVVHVIATDLQPGDVLDVRYVPPDKIVLAGTDIDWDATPWRLVARYAHDSD